MAFFEKRPNKSFHLIFADERGEERPQERLVGLFAGLFLLRCIDMSV